ncbi:hypothetical protein D3C78_1694920 [compost metagenome]
MMMLHPVFAGVEQLLALFVRQSPQGGVRGVGQLGKLLTEVWREGLRTVPLQEGLPVLFT